MTSMVENVARAIDPMSAKIVDMLMAKGLSREVVLGILPMEKARAAIEAMREPTGAMTKVAAEDILTGPGISAFLNWQDLSASRYRLMIDAALSEDQ